VGLVRHLPTLGLALLPLLPLLVPELAVAREPGVEAEAALAPGLPEAALGGVPCTRSLTAAPVPVIGLLRRLLACCCCFCCAVATAAVVAAVVAAAAAGGI